MSGDVFEYFDGSTPCIGYIARPESGSANLPVVMVVHDWSGCNSFAKATADRLASLGYIGFAIDVFGEGKIGHTKEEKSALIKPYIEDRSLLLARMQAALAAARLIKGADIAQVSAIGFCFGGLCVLDLARSGAELNAVVSFHGLFMPSSEPAKSIKAKVLALHGYDDPMVKPEQMIAFANEMTEAKADWQINAYGNTMHAFTNPQANDPVFGTVYNPVTADRAWQAMCLFLKEKTHRT